MKRERTNWKKMYDELYEIRIEDLKEQEGRFSKIIKEILDEHKKLDRELADGEYWMNAFHKMKWIIKEKAEIFFNS